VMAKKGPEPAQCKFIGEIRTPYGPDRCPRWPDENLPDTARIILFPEYQAGLKDLEKFKYVFVLFYLDRPHKQCSLVAHPPGAQGMEVGVFASRSPCRPNRIGLSVARVLKIENGEIITSAIDAFDRTPLIDLKPYFRDDDMKTEANNGWLDSIPGGRGANK